MRKLAMKLQTQEGIGRGTNEDIQIGSEPGEEADPHCETGFILVAGTGTGKGSTSKSLGERIHKEQAMRGTKLRRVQRESGESGDDRNV